MKDRIFAFFLVGMLIIASIVIVKANTEEKNFKGSIELSRTVISVTAPTLSTQDEYVTLDLAEAESYLSTTGRPMLPVITRTYAFPLGTRIDDVSVDLEMNEMTLEKKITPTPLILPLSIEVSAEVMEQQRIDESVYESAEWFPEQPYSVRLGSGIEDGEQVVFVNVQIMPQYAPDRDIVKIPEDIEIEISYENPSVPSFTADEYDLLIITHPLFEADLQPLVYHKNNLGMRTKMETVDTIYASYDGVADWEDIKLYIADCIEDYGIEFVLLAGGHKGQTSEWYVPDFRSNNWDPNDSYDPPWDDEYSSDLYFADVYKINEFQLPEFDDWDTNDNGIYAEGPNSPTGTDNPDFYPNVHVGRLPFRYTWEVPIAVNKIIDYELNAKDSWYKKGVICGGDGFPTERYPEDAIPGIYEGEIVGDEFAALLEQEGFDTTRCYLSNGGDVYVEDAKDVYDVISQGAGWVHLTGHASPILLGSYHPNVLPLIPFYTNFNARLFETKGTLPFMVNEGCHNAQFDVTTQELITGLLTEDPHFWTMFSRDEWVHHDTSSLFVLQKEGGAIAVIGNTALGSGGLNDGCTEFVGGWIMLRFAEAYAVDGMEYTGTIWNKGITEYINYFPVAPSNVAYGFDVQGDTTGRKTIEERVLIGDPSIKLGGYGTVLGDDSESKEEVIYGAVSADVPVWSKGDQWTYRLDNIDFNLNPDPEIGRSLEMKLSMGDIIMEVTDVTSSSYISSINSDDIDLTIGGTFDFHVSGKDTLAIQTVEFSNIQLDGELVVDKETLGIMDIKVGIIIDIIENLDSLSEIVGIELPGFINILLPFMSIPATIELNIGFENPVKLLDFPLENDKYWQIQENTIEIEIDGTVKSIWLRLINFLDTLFSFLPPELSQFLPVIDIAEVLNYYDIETFYEIELPELDLKNDFKTKMFEVWGTENVVVPAGSYNSVHVSIIEENGILYYSDDIENVVKLTGYIGDYIPIIEDLNLELIG